MSQPADTQNTVPVAPSELQGLVDRVFAGLAARNADDVLACFTADGVLIDPHYPARRMAGTAAIAEGLDWLFGIMSALRFDVANRMDSADGRHAAVEVGTHHTLRSGQDLRFTQVFIAEMQGRLLTRLEAYEPYGPPGIGGAALRLSHLRFRMARRRRPAG